MAFRVELSANATLDLESISDWLFTQKAGENATRWLKALREEIASLANSPRRCARIPESEIFPFEVRHLLYGRKPHVYRVLFTIEADRVFVLSVHHGHKIPIVKM